MASTYSLFFMVLKLFYVFDPHLYVTLTFYQTFISNLISKKISYYQWLYVSFIIFLWFCLCLCLCSFSWSSKSINESILYPDTPLAMWAYHYTRRPLGKSFPYSFPPGALFILSVLGGEEEGRECSGHFYTTVVHKYHVLTFLHFFHFFPCVWCSDLFCSPGALLPK